MGNVARSVCEDEVVDVGVRKWGVFILEEAIEQEDYAEKNCGCKDICWIEE